MLKTCNEYGIPNIIKKNDRKKVEKIMNQYQFELKTYQQHNNLINNIYK